MKYYILVLFSIFIISCQNTEIENLYGIWKTKDFLDTTNNNFEDKITFTKDSVMIIEIISKKKIVSKLIESYSLRNNILTLKYNNAHNFDFKIIKLNKSEMELLNLNENKIIKYVRY
jgi:hypothetical protein